LTELHRASNVARMQLPGLSTDEVRRLLAETSQQTVPQPFAELVQHQTEGNPLFVRETLRFVMDAGLVEQRDGALRRVGDQTLAGRIPEGLRDAVSKRLSRLSENTNRFLSVASVIGREFQLDVLRPVLAGSDEELEAALEEALAAAIIEEHSAVGASTIYRFSHAFFRQTLYDEIVAPRRNRLHQQVAHALEEIYSRRLGEHAHELAEHYSFYSDTLNLAKAVEYGELAAKHATEVFAYGEAARQLDRALVVQDLVDPDDRAKRCDMLLSLGEALFPAGETERAIRQVAPDAFALAEGLGDRSRAFRASRLAVDCLFAHGAAIAAAQSEYLTWSERATQYAAPESIERVHADVALATTRYNRGEFAQARQLRLEALALARRHADSEGLFKAASFHLGQPDAPQHWDERVRLAEECAGWPRQAVSSQILGMALRFCGQVQLTLGERARAEELWVQARELGERTRAAFVGNFTTSTAAILGILDGRLEDVLASLRRMAERANETGSAVGWRYWASGAMMMPALYLGRADVWLTAFDEHAGVMSRAQAETGSWTASAALCSRVERRRCRLHAAPRPCVRPPPHRRPADRPQGRAAAAGSRASCRRLRQI
jgi:hypothetical protein